MAIQYIPRQRSPWEQMLPSFMQNIMFQNMAQKRALAQQEAQQKRREEEEIRGYKAKGWREPDKQKPIITVGDTGLVPPEKGYEVKTVKGRQVLVESMTPYGGKPQVQKASVVTPTKPEVKYEQMNPLTIGDNKIFRQKNLATNKVEYSQFGFGDKQLKPGTVDVWDPKTGRTYIYPTYVRDGKMIRGDEPIGEKRPAGKGMKVKLPDGTEISMGGGGQLTTGTQTAIEKEVVGLTEQLQEVTNLENNAFTDALTLQGKLYQQGLRFADWVKIPLSGKQKKYLGSARTFVEGIEQIFNKYRKEITGAQAAMKEITMLRDSILNKKLTPTEFKASVERYKGQILRSLRLKRMLLAQGVSGENLGKRIDNLYMAGQDVPASELERRGDELESSGYSQEEVLKILKQEGYV